MFDKKGAPSASLKTTSTIVISALVKKLKNFPFSSKNSTNLCTKKLHYITLLAVASKYWTLYSNGHKLPTLIRLDITTSKNKIRRWYIVVYQTYCTQNRSHWVNGAQKNQHGFSKCDVYMDWNYTVPQHAFHHNYLHFNIYTGKLI